MPYGYAASGRYVADSVGARHVAKREAEADAWYGNYGLGGYGGYAGYGGYGGQGGYAGVGLAYSGAYAAPATSGAITLRGHGTPVTIGAYQPYGYAASGQYRADSVGAVHIAKREAEASYRYGGYGGYGGYPGPQTSGLSTVSPAGFPLQGYSQGYGYGW